MPVNSILQISDLHFLPHSGETVLGIDTDYYFRRILEHAFATHQRFDLILVTGDLTHEPYEDSYRRIEQKLQAYGIPCICLPGNHDDERLMQKTLNKGWVSCRKQAFLDNWQIIALNSRVPGSPEGRLDKQELVFLENCLRNYPERHALIAVHHHCQPIDSPWLDTMIIENAEEFIAVLRRYPKAKAVTCGHIHQEIDQYVDSIRLLSAPSTCFQFEPKSVKFSLVDTAPGYRVIHLHQDGRLKTEVYRLAEALKELQVDGGTY